MNSVVESILIFKEVFKEDTAITVENLEEIIFTINGDKIILPVKKGDKIENNLIREKLRKEKKTISVYLNKETHGVDLKITNIPIKDEKEKIIGAISFIQSMEKEYGVQNISQELFTAIENTNKFTESISREATELSSKISEVNNNAVKTFSKLEESKKIISSILNISKKANLLGLNASIESARVGDLGRGFAVVAEEMRSLSITSGKLTGNIEQILREIENNIRYILELSNKLDGVGINQEKDIQSIYKIFNEILGTSKHLTDILKKDYENL